MSDWNNTHLLRAQVLELLNEDSLSAYSTICCARCGQRWTNRQAMLAQYADDASLVGFDTVPTDEWLNALTDAVHDAICLRKEGRR